MNKFIFPLLFSVLLCTNAAASASAKYIFLFIGDGMGLSHLNLTEVYYASKLSFTQFPSLGLVSTFSSNHYVTDSAAAGTALATGNKTSVETISMDATGTKPFKSIAEMARDKGMKVGIISTVFINDATPAAFYAHRKNRYMLQEIAQDMANSNFDLFAGGGFKKAGLSIAIEKGYKITKNKKELEALKKGDKKLMMLCPHQDRDSACPYSMEQKPDDISLKEFTEKAIELLDNEKGFFIMAEAGKIDWASHKNNARAAVEDVKALDSAVYSALAFYKKHPDDTLIIVTSDHETGGLSVGVSENPSSARSIKHLENNTGIGWTTKSHTGTYVGVFAIGAGSELLRGYIDNTDIPKAIIKGGKLL